MAYHYARYYLDCGHTADVPATLQEVRNPVICEKCSYPTELYLEGFDQVRDRWRAPGVSEVHPLH